MKLAQDSKTVWFNVIMTLILATPPILAAFKAMSPEQAVFADSVGTLIIGLGNVVLRVWFTEVPIATTPDQVARAKYMKSGN
jgi:hypothetical protein